MNLFSKIGLSVATLGVIAVGTLGVAGCSGEPQEDVASSTAQSLTIVRASKTTTKNTGVTQWELSPASKGFVARGVDAKRGEKGVFEVVPETNERGDIVGSTTRVVYRDQTFLLHYTPKGGSEAVSVTPGAGAFLAAMVADIEAASAAADKKGGVATKDYWDECYECANPPPPSNQVNDNPPPPPPSRPSSYDNCMDNTRVQCGTNGCNVQTNLSCLAALGGWAWSHIYGCNSTCGPSQMCVPVGSAPFIFPAVPIFACVDRWVPGGSGSTINSGGGGGGGGSGGIGCKSDWDCIDGFYCTSMGTCGS